MPSDPERRSSARRRRGPRWLVRVRRAWREVSEVFAFLRSGAGAILEVLFGRWPSAGPDDPRRDRR